MGMDGIEIVMKVEESFDIAIEDAEAEKITTPSLLIELVVSKVGRTDHAACLTQRAFHRLRSSLMGRLGMKRNQIRPETLLVELFPRPTRKKQICEVLCDVGVTKSVELIRPAWLNNSIVAGIFGGGIAIAVFLAWQPINSSFSVVNFLLNAPVVMGIFFAFLFGWIAVLATRGQRYEFEPSMTTVANLSRWIVANAPSSVQSPPGQWSREQIAEIVREIVIEVLDCEKKYREDASFVKDLGLS